MSRVHRFAATLALVCMVMWLGPQASAVQGDTRTVVEFELPTSDVTLIKNGGSIRVQVGYFGEGVGDEPLFSYSAAPRVTPEGHVRVTLQAWKAPTAAAIVVRVRTLVSGSASPWSAPSAPITPESLTGGNNRAAFRAARRAARESKAAAQVVEQLQSNSTLTSLLAQKYPGVDLEKGVTGYANLRNFIATLIVSTRLKISFEELKPLTLSRERNAFEMAIQKLRPGTDAAAEARSALTEAADIIRQTRRRAPGKP
jgi:hypothetical protein